MCRHHIFFTFLTQEDHRINKLLTHFSSKIRAGSVRGRDETITEYMGNFNSMYSVVAKMEYRTPKGAGIPSAEGAITEYMRNFNSMYSAIAKME